MMDDTDGPPAKRPRTALSGAWRCWAFWAAIAGACAAVAAWRVGVYTPLDPMVDQVFYVQWIKRLRLADHLLPMAGDGQTFLAALMQDEDSLLNIYLRQVYAAHPLIFTAFSVVWLYGGSFAFGTDIDGQVALSIWTGAAAIFVLTRCNAAFFEERHTADSGPRYGARYATAGLTILFVLIDGFMTDFAATGGHNIGILALFSALALTARWLRAGGFAVGMRPSAAIMAVQLIALYTYYTNVFLLPVATFLALVAARRFRQAAAYSALIVLFMAPALAIVAIDKAGLLGITSAASFFKVGGDVMAAPGGLLDTIVDQSQRWFVGHGLIIGHFSFAVAVAGLAAIWKFERVSLYFFVVLAHLGASAVLPGFLYFQKTSGYLVPLLLMGLAYACVRAALIYNAARRGVGMRRAVAGIALAAAVLAGGRYLATEIDGFDGYPRRGIMAGLVERGTGLRAIAAEIDASLRAGDTVIPGDDLIGHWYMAYSARAGHDVGLFRPLDTMLTRLDAGQLQPYLARRGLKPPVAAGSVIIARPADIDGTDAVRRLFGPTGFGTAQTVWIERLATWKADGRPKPPLPLGLYRLH